MAGIENPMENASALRNCQHEYNHVFQSTFFPLRPNYSPMVSGKEVMKKKMATIRNSTVCIVYILLFKR